MTLDQALAQRDTILQNFGISKSSYQGRSIEYTTGPGRIVELARIEEEIQKLQDEQAGTGSTRCRLATFRRD